MMLNSFIVQEMGNGIHMPFNWSGDIQNPLSIGKVSPGVKAKWSADPRTHA